MTGKHDNRFFYEESKRENSPFSQMMTKKLELINFNNGNEFNKVTGSPKMNKHAYITSAYIIFRAVH